MHCFRDFFCTNGPLLGRAHAESSLSGSLVPFPCGHFSHNGPDYELKTLIICTDSDHRVSRLWSIRAGSRGRRIGGR
jgi:hypothetical protein